MHFLSQVSLRAEQEMAVKLLEKDVHEKQDTIISLRDQLDDIKHINLEMYTKLQVSSDGPFVWILQAKHYFTFCATKWALNGEILEISLSCLNRAR